MFLLVVGLLVIAFGFFVLRRGAGNATSPLGRQFSRANNSVSGIVVIVIGVVLVLFGLLDVVG